jgi:adenylosuccinate synthase
VLDELKTMQVAYKYKTSKKEKAGSFPFDLADAKPLYKKVKGWNAPTDSIRKYKDLPANAKKYIIMIEKHLDSKISYISVGQMRDAIVRKED